ncbi:MAG: ribosome silencing factor [Candidatus Omnitrophota bacterium]
MTVKKLKTQEKAKLIAKCAEEKKGEDIVLMDMRGISMMCDWFVIISGTSSRQINAIANGIAKDLSKKVKIYPLSIEGKQNASWVLLDYEDVVVHVFHKGIRDFYGLERLWSDAPQKRF